MSKITKMLIIFFRHTAAFISFTLLFCISSVTNAETVDTAELFDSSSFTQADQLKAILEQPENTIDFTQAKFTIDKMVDPSIDVEVNLKAIDTITKTIQSMLPANPTSMDKMLTIKKYLYEAGSWNNNQPYQYDFNDPLGTKITNKLLPTYLETKKGNCTSMPFLFIVLSQRLGIDATVAKAPLHFLVKFTESETGHTYNVETVSGAGFSRDIWYQQTMHITDEALRNGIYLRKLSKQETVAMMATVLAEDYYERQEFEKSMMISDVILNYSNTDVASMLRKGSIFYKLLAKNYIKKYPTPNLIPIPERPYFKFLDTNNRYWFERAESLGWREPTQEDEENYLKRVQESAKLIQNQQ